MRAIIFDFDGVIVDSETYWDAETIHVYQQMFLDWTDADDRRLKGRNVHDIYDMLAGEYGFTMPKEEYMRRLNAFALGIYETRTQLLDGVTELVKLVKGRGLPSAIASSSEREWIDIALKRLGMVGVFQPIVTARDVGIGKPDPAVYLEAARRLGVPPADCLAIEDSPNGIKAAKAAGMYCIGLRHLDGKYPDPLSEADKVVTSLREIDDALLERLMH
jgi:beta-phosphoglucomutase